MRPGYRTISLRDKKGTLIDLCCLLLYVDLGEAERPMEEVASVSDEGDDQIHHGNLAVWRATRQGMVGKVKPSELRQMGAAMSAHLHNERVAFMGCAALANLAHVANARAIADASGLLHLTSLMSAQPHSGEVQRAGVCALANLAVDEGCLMVMLLHSGAAELVAHALVEQPDPKVQREGCATLARLAWGGEEARVWEVGGAQLACDALGGEDEEASEQAAWMIAGLAKAGSSQRLLMLRRLQLAEMLVTVGARSRHAGLSQGVVCALCELSGGEEEAGLVVAAGGVGLVVGKLSSHTAHLPLLHEACAALVAMCAADPLWGAEGEGRAEVISQAVKGGVVSSLCETLKKPPSPSSRYTKLMSLRALFALSASPPARKALLSQGVVELCCLAMDEHGDSPHLLQAACNVLSALVGEGDAHLAAENAGAAEAFTALTTLLALSPRTLKLIEALDFASLAALRTGGASVLESQLDARLYLPSLEALASEREGWGEGEGEADVVAGLCDVYAGLAEARRGEGVMEAVGPPRLARLTAAAKAYPSLLSLLCFVSEAFAAVAHSGEEAANAVVAADAVSVVMEALHTHCASPRLRHSALSTLAAVSCVTSGKIEIKRLSFLRPLVTALELDPTAEACAWGCTALANLACDELQSKREIALAGSVKAVCGAMAKQRGRPQLQASGCRLLGNLCADTSLVAPVVHAGAIHLVATAMMSHPYDQTVQEEGCAVMGNIAFAHPKWRGQLVSVDGAHLVCVALHNHASSQGVLREACGALANLSHDEQAGEQANKSGGAAYVAASMAAHLQDEMIQRYGITALDNLGVKGVSDHDDSRLLTSSSHLATPKQQLASHTRVCAAMKAHLSSPSLLELGCRALANLCRSSADARRSVVHAGGAHLVCEAMDRYVGHVMLQRRGCAAIANMAHEESAGVVCSLSDVRRVDHKLAKCVKEGVVLTSFRMVCRCGGVERVLDAMEAHAHDETVCEEGCSAVSNLSCGDSTVRSAMGRLSCAERVVGAMLQHAQAAGVQREGCNAIANLAWGEMQKRVVQSCGGVELVLCGMRMHLGFADVVESGCKALHNLACNTDDLRIELIAQGAVHVVCEGLRRHASVVGVQLEGSVCLAALAKDDPHTKEVLTSLGGVAALIKALRTHKHHAEMQRWGYKALRSLASTSDLMEISSNERSDKTTKGTSKEPLLPKTG
ncbi:MAG: hypothetical protein SGPRY_001914 [Prymnesium sp.]